ncbi:MAG: DNA repair protein, partial [Candidatus Nitrosotenuis sp.]
MGLFKRKKEEKAEPAEQKHPEEQVRIKSPEEIRAEQAATELAYLEGEIRSKTEHLRSITEKLSLVKQEYDQVTASLMSTKKEINERKSKIDS